MGKCVIFCAGGFDGLHALPDKDDYIIAADGGYTHLEKLGITPDCILGDFDSLGYIPNAAQVFPVEKDDTDAMLAVRHGLSLGYREFILYGALDGPRLDHTVANLQTLCFLAEHGAHGTLVGLSQAATVIKNGCLRFPAGCEGYISVFCMGQTARGITLTGLKYSLENGILTGSFPLGASNEFTGEAACVCAEEGTLLVIFPRGCVPC